MDTVYIFLMCCYCFAFVTCANDYYGYVTSDSSLSVKSVANELEAKYQSSNSSTSEAKTPNSDSGYETLQNEIHRHCEDLFMCVQLKMLMNVSDILKADRYNLAQNVVLEKVADGEVGNGISRMDLEKLKYSDKKNFGYVTALLVQKTLDIFKTHFLKWDMLPGINIRIFRNLNYGGGMDLALEVQEPRTFGGPRKRLMILLPLAYKMGVMTTMLGALLVLTLKGLTIGVILLILAVGNVFSKHKFHGFPHHAPTDIHVHIHNDAHGQAYSGWHKEYVDHSTLHADHSGYNRRRWLPQPQQTASLPYPDFL